MEISKAYNKIIDFFLSKGWNLGLNENNNRKQATFGYNDCLILYIGTFPKWQELLNRGYSNDQLIDYFLEIIRYHLSELKGLEIEFNLNYNLDFKQIPYKIIKI